MLRDYVVVPNKNPKLRITLAQVNPCVGDVSGNIQLVKAAIQQAAAEQAEVVLFPELVLSGYAQDDLVFRPDFIAQMQQAVLELAQVAPQLTVIIGVPLVREGILRNMACVLRDGKVMTEYAKQELPNYRVFDEKRWFVADDKSLVIEVAGCRAGILICEDIWHDAPIDKLAALGNVDVVLILNASPYRANKQTERHALLKRHIERTGLPIAYVNLVGGQDELAFDGASMLVNSKGVVIYQAPFFVPEIKTLDWHWASTAEAPVAWQHHLESEVYHALVLGVRDYVRKNGFKKVLLGLSGGIDSGLVVAIAVDALGAENVMAVMMPFHYTAQMSVDDAALQANMLGVEYLNLPIVDVFNAFQATLAPAFIGRKADVTEENLQARIRGTLLMSLSNKLGSLLMVTSNKSESAVGYATLYGDMAGAFAPLKDVYKTLVYRLASYRNTVSPAIPQRVIDRPPSAELAPGQVDQDSLPPYEVLDAILQHFIEEDAALESIVAAGFAKQTVRKVVNLVLLSEYKRQQAAPGVRISNRAFGKDWRYPITSGWRRNLPM